MSADVETPVTLPTFPRPSSLYVPDIPRTVPILDTTSYSPFPTFPGTNHRSRDPYGLNAYLLHPDDSLWHYVDPMPDPKGPSPQHHRSASLGEESELPQRTRTLKKQRSLSGLTKPSPLSRPPVGSEDEVDDVEEKLVPLQRRRSSSLSSSPVLSSEEQVKIIETFCEDTAQPPKTPKGGKKSLRRAFTMARKSVFGTTDSEPLPPVPALPEAPSLVAPSVSISGSPADSADPTTPISSRSNSNYSSVSSASSTSSSEGVKTPAEGVSAEIAITGSKLANALQEAGEKKNKGKGWRWLGAKKGGKLAAAKDGDNSGSTTPLSGGSAASTPNSSTTDLLAGAVPKVTLTPSPAITTPPRGFSSVLPPSELPGKQHTWATEQLRRVSMRKLTQLRNPSPHPLALSLRRQHSKLPDEVAFSIRSDQRVFPMSVNSHRGSEGDLVPAQGGLWLNIAISKVVTKLDQGEQPEGILKLRKNGQKSTIPRPRGVLDFINRPPFEERNIVFYPDHVFSPISMARPGYGVWDLDFSPYLLALSAIDEPSTSWPAMPRASFEDSTDDFAEAIKAFADNAEDEEGVELLKSPAPPTDHGPVAALKLLTGNLGSNSSTPSASPAQSPSKPRPLSSFRPAGSHSKSASSSSSSESDDESEEDDEPLAVVAKRRSQSFHSQPRPAANANANAVASVSTRPAALYSRSHSQPDKRAARRHSTHLESELKSKGIQQQSAMEEVARARERREANRTGEVEKRAMGEQVRAQQQAKRRSSMLDLSATNTQPTASSSKHKKNSSSTALVPIRPPAYISPASASQLNLAPPVRPSEGQRRRSQPASPVGKQLAPPARPEAYRSRTGPSQSPSEDRRKRYHSFYEQKAASTSSPSFHSSPSVQPHPHPHPHPHPVNLPHVPAYPHHPFHAQMHAQAHGFPQPGMMQRGSMYGMAYPAPQTQMYGNFAGAGMPMGVGSPAGKRTTRMA